MHILSLLVALTAHTASLEVVGGCSPEPIFRTEAPILPRESLGAFTVRAFSDNGLEFIGAEHGINSIQGSPTGEEALEIISREEMNAYGWCYELNGRLFEGTYPDEVFPASDQDEITWFYGYAHYFRGEWKTMCEPAWKRRPDFLCKKNG